MTTYQNIHVPDYITQYTRISSAPIRQNRGSNQLTNGYNNEKPTQNKLVNGWKDRITNQIIGACKNARRVIWTMSNVEYE